MDMFRILSGILHMGNVIIEKDERAIDKCHIAVSSNERVFLYYSYCNCFNYWLCVGTKSK